MTKLISNWTFRAVTLGAIACLSGCGGDDGTVVPPTIPTSDTIDFQIFTNQAFSNSANSSPVSVDVTFNFDTNDNPTAFDSLIESGTY